jgi:predicted murein hydrolase (TIGR00659 family)
MIMQIARTWLADAMQPATWIALTILVYVLATEAQRRCKGSPLLNPTLLSIAAVIAILLLTHADYGSYFRAVEPIHLLLGPATVALGLPLYKQLHVIRSNAVPVMAGVIVGAVAACASAVGIAWLLGGSPELLRSLAPKSITAPIAMSVSQEIGGSPTLTASLVILTGIIGAVLCQWLFDWIGVKSWPARGLATGITAHGIGTGAILATNEVAGAFAGLAIGLTGLFTAIVLPIIAGCFHG